MPVPEVTRSDRASLCRKLRMPSIHLEDIQSMVKEFVSQSQRKLMLLSQRIGSEMAPLVPPRLTAWLTCALSFFTLTTGALPASAAVLISVNESTQQMSVSVDGVPRYRFAVSTGRAGYGTPSGTYRRRRLAASWFSKLYYNSPMPHSIFFHGGYAIHGSYEINRLRRTCLTWLHPSAPRQRRSPVRTSEKRRPGGDDHRRLRR